MTDFRSGRFRAWWTKQTLRPETNLEGIQHSLTIVYIYELDNNKKQHYMRKVISFMHISLDGFVAGPNREMNWIKVDEEIYKHFRLSRFKCEN